MASEMQPFDILIINAHVVTMDPDRRVFFPGSVAVRGNKIAAVEAGEDPARADARQVMDAQGDIILPGLINGHTHLPMTLFRGLADDLDLQTWLNEHIFPAERQHITPDTVEAGALLACLEMLLSAPPAAATAISWKIGRQKPWRPRGCGGSWGRGWWIFPPRESRIRPRTWRRPPPLSANGQGPPAGCCPLFFATPPTPAGMKP